MIREIKTGWKEATFWVIFCQIWVKGCFHYLIKKGPLLIEVGCLYQQWAPRLQVPKFCLRIIQLGIWNLGQASMKDSSFIMWYGLLPIFLMIIFEYHTRIQKQNLTYLIYLIRRRHVCFNNSVHEYDGITWHRIRSNLILVVALVGNRYA